MIECPAAWGQGWHLDEPAPMSMPCRRTCQYIAGEPSADDRCKCRRPALPGSPYCEIHGQICRAHGEEMEQAEMG